MKARRATATAAAFLPLLALLAACSPTVALDPAADAGSPDCAAVTVRLPSSIDEGDTTGGSASLALRDTNAQATGAWGDPVSVVLHCGVDTPAPTSELPCVTVPGGTVDWLVDDSDAPDYKFTSYGRKPAVSVVVDYDTVSGTAVLQALDNAVSQLPKVGACVGVDDVTPAATPTPEAAPAG